MKRTRNFVSFMFLSYVAGTLSYGTRAYGEPSQCTHQANLSQILGLEAPSDFYSSTKIDLDSLALSPADRYTSRLYMRLTGATLPLKHPRFKKFSEMVEAGNILAAAKMMTNEKEFLQYRVRNFAAPYTNLTFSNQEPLNDLQALIIGITRDELDARLLLTGNIRYSAYRSLGLPEVSLENNDHYIRFDALGLDPQSDLQKVDKQWPQMTVAAGAFTTRAWARVFYDGGTNRRAVKFAFENFLCAPIDSWKIRGIPDYFVRRDVPRDPGGEPATYQNHCRNCHAPMDAMGGSFARMDFVNNTFLYSPNKVAEKMNQKPEFYPEGYVTMDDSWQNLLAYNPSLNLGFRSKLEGEGIQSFAHHLANAFGYSQCFVTKVFKEVCGKSPKDESPELVDALAKDFEANGYNLKYLFAKISSLNVCISP